MCERGWLRMCVDPGARHKDMVALEKRVKTLERLTTPRSDHRDIARRVKALEGKFPKVEEGGFWMSREQAKRFGFVEYTPKAEPEPESKFQRGDVVRTTRPPVGIYLVCQQVEDGVDRFWHKVMLSGVRPDGQAFFATARPDNLELVHREEEQE